MNRPRVLVVYKRSTLERYRGVKDPRIAHLLRAKDESVSRLVASHDEHRETIASTRESLARLGAVARFAHTHIPKPGERWDLVVTLGGDGTLLWTSHLVGPETPMVAINSAPVTSVGYFCAGTGADVGSILKQALAGQLRRTRLNRMQVEIDKKVVSKRILNDVLFCHECPAAASRYVLRHGRRTEEQLSSGLWIGPAAGSTAAQRSAGGRVLAPGSRKIQYVVREPYHGLGEPTRLARGLVAPNEALVVKSKIREGMLYMDGHNKTVSVDIGQEVRLTSSNEPLFLLGLRR
jgi:NAD+ kinase